MEINMLLLLAAILMLLLTACKGCQTVEQRFKFSNRDIYLRLIRGEKLQYELMKGSQSLQKIALDNFMTSSNLIATNKDSFMLTDGIVNIEFELIRSNYEGTHVRVTREEVPAGAQPRDCLSLDIGHANWFSGIQHSNQYWPIEKHIFQNFSYVTKEENSASIAERYWLNSKGLFVYVDDTTPLFIDQNSEGHENELCFSAHNALPYNVRVPKVSFSYHIVIAKDPKAAHMYAVKYFLGKPTGYPDKRMVQHPIWSTWALYKAEVDDKVVREFGDKILEHGFENSQLEIDDDWENCYGALTFRKNKFPNVKKLTNDLKAKGFRITLWVHPFINKNCTTIYNEAKNKGYLVLDHNGNPDTKWWNSRQNDAAFIDFTKEEVQNWFKERLKQLQTEDGIDSFKFDAGETSWIPADPVLQGDKRRSPTQITSDFVRCVSGFGPMIEVRSGQGTQDLPIFVRMLDKDSEWGWNSGLVTLVPTLMQMNLQGYVFVLPDMIGGNGYREKPPTKELFIRWLQANVFMPSLQFSYVPWYFDAETIEISKTFTKLHSDYTPYIMKRFKLAVETGEPVNPPIWWVDPKDAIAHTVYDEFLLGDDIIAAPIVTEGATRRDIYLPKGQWKDGNNNKVYRGPVWVMNYEAPLNILPYFTRVGIKFN